MSTDYVKPTNATVEFNTETQVFEVFFTLPDDKCFVYSFRSCPSLGDYVCYQKALDMCIKGIKV